MARKLIRTGSFENPECYVKDYATSNVKSLIVFKHEHDLSDLDFFNVPSVVLVITFCGAVSATCRIS